jgi:hypothetical protein
MLHGDWAAAKEEVSKKKNERENNKTYQKNPACTCANPYLQQA